MSVALRFAYDERDSEDTRSEKAAIFIVATACCVAGLVWGAMYYAVLGWGLSTALPLVFSVGVGSALLVAHHTRDHRVAVYAQLLGIICVTACLQWSLGGLFESGFVLAWGFLGPIGALFFFPYRRAIPWFVLYLASLVVTVAFDSFFAAHGPSMPTWAPTLFFIMNVSISSAIVFVFAAYFVTTSAVQRKRADDLLLNTLPRQIVPILKSGTRTVAEHYDSATVLFADIVGSTRRVAERDLLGLR
jgi:guanylate cyclase